MESDVVTNLGLQVLHLYGGIWVDTDTVLLKDARAVVECALFLVLKHCPDGA